MINHEDEKVYVFLTGVAAGWTMASIVVYILWQC